MCLSTITLLQTSILYEQMAKYNLQTTTQAVTKEMAERIISLPAGNATHSFRHNDKIKGSFDIYPLILHNTPT